MVDPTVLITLGAMTSGAVAFGLRVEHRLTRLEDKMDIMLKNNGIEPKDCCKPKGKRK